MAEELFNCGEEKWGTDEETFVRIFSTQDYYTMRMVWDEYVKVSLLWSVEGLHILYVTAIKVA